MPEVREADAIIQTAEKAAGAGDYATAENLLREAARLQEASLGPRHADLANTLNNLGIVCERTGKPDDAEQYFRRAVSIARTSLAPDHPFVATSQKNLRDFCETRGRTVGLPPTPPATEVPSGMEVVQAPRPAQAVDTDLEPEDPEVTSKKFFIRFALGALGPIAMLMVVLAAGLPRLGAPELAAPLPVPAPVESPPIPAETTTNAATNTDAGDEAATSDITPAPDEPVVVRASLCGDLDEWSCDPADRPVPPGPLFFYTRLRSTSATTVEHRWYYGDHLRQTVRLQIQADETGYRIYSRRNLMESDSAHGWRLELRSEDGALLHEERFTVR